MKLKTILRTVEDVETDIDLPIYLYSQDEYCNDKYVKWDGKTQTTVEYSWFGFKIERYDSPLHIEEHELRNLTTENQFNDAFYEALKNLKSAKKK